MHSPTWHQALENNHAALAVEGRWRAREILATPQQTHVTRSGRTLINFASNDYLGLANHPMLIDAAVQANRDWGVGSGASHLVCGHQSPHAELERELAEFVDAESALLFSSGYMANLALATSFLGSKDLLLQDKLNHASLIDGGRLSKATFKRYAHCDIGHADRILRVNDYQRCAIMTDSVFSMDGDQAPLRELKRLAQQNRGLLIVDDAHGFGVRGDDGRGSLNACGLAPKGDILMMATLGKALGGYGAFVAGDKIFIEHLVQTARSYIYTTAIPAALAATSLAALNLIREQGAQLQTALQANIEYFTTGAIERGLILQSSETAIQPWVIGVASSASNAAEQLLGDGFNVVAIRPPTVPQNTSRLRIALSAAHSKDDVNGLLSAMERIEL